jgi:hypothetical protein
LPHPSSVGPHARPFGSQLVGTQPSPSSPASPDELLDDDEVDDVVLLDDAVLEDVVLDDVLAALVVEVVVFPPEPDSDAAATTTVLSHAAIPRITAALSARAATTMGFMTARSMVAARARCCPDPGHLLRGIATVAVAFARRHGLSREIRRGIAVAQE